jgi:hypothetical protein
LVGRPKGRKPLRIPRHRGEDGIKIDLQEVGGVAWTGLMWLRIGAGGSWECGNEQSGYIKCREFLN